MRICMLGWGSLLLMMACAHPPPPPAPPAPPPPPEPAEVLVENLPTEPIEVAVPVEATPEPEPAPEPAPENTAEPASSKDPFDSNTVDDNREGRHIMKRALTLPEADPPSH